MAFGGDGGGRASMLTRKLGPLPVWAWGGLGLGGALALSAWRKNRAGPVEEDDGTLGGYQLPETMQPTYAFVDADQYTVTVPQAPPGGGREPAAPVTPTTPATPATKPTTPKPKTPPKARAEYRAAAGDSLAKIAKKYGLTWQALYKYNTTPGVRSSAAIKTIKSRGPSKIYANSLWLIPPKGYK